MFWGQTENSSQPDTRDVKQEGVKEAVAPEATVETEASATPEAQVETKPDPKVESKPKRDNGLIPRERYNQKRDEVNALKAKLAEFEAKMQTNQAQTDPEEDVWETEETKGLKYVTEYIRKQEEKEQKAQLESMVSKMENRISEINRERGGTKEFQTMRAVGITRILVEKPHLTEDEAADIFDEAAEKLKKAAGYTVPEVKPDPVVTTKPKPSYSDSSAPTVSPSGTNTNSRTFWK